MNNKIGMKFGILSFGLSLLVGCGGGGGGGGDSSTSSELTSGVEVSGSVGVNEWDYYSIAIPANTWSVSAILTATSGEVDIVGKQGVKPTADMYNADLEDCSDYSIAGMFDSYCSITLPAEGTVYFGAWGNPVSDSGASGGNYTLVATIQTDVLAGVTVTSREQIDTDLRRIANRYLKHYRGATISAGSDAYPESGIVEIQKGEDVFRFYFGADAVNAVLSIDHNGTWTHFQSWSEFETTLSNIAN